MTFYGPRHYYGHLCLICTNLALSMPRAQPITKSDIDLRRVNRTRSRSENTPTFPTSLEGPQLCHDSKRGADR
jgi:hypothetical protein